MTTPERLHDPAPERTLGDMLYKARKMAGLSVKELALKSRVSRNSLHAYEADDRPPRIYMLESIATATEQKWLLEYGYLCRGEDDGSSHLRLDGSLWRLPTSPQLELCWPSDEDPDDGGEAEGAGFPLFPVAA